MFQATLVLSIKKGIGFHKLVCDLTYIQHTHSIHKYTSYIVANICGFTKTETT